MQKNSKDCINEKGIHLNTDNLELFYNVDLGYGKGKRKQWADYTFNKVIVIWWVCVSTWDRIFAVSLISRKATNQQHLHFSIDFVTMVSNVCIGISICFDH